MLKNDNPPPQKEMNKYEYQKKLRQDKRESKQSYQELLDLNEKLEKKPEDEENQEKKSEPKFIEVRRKHHGKNNLEQVGTDLEDTTKTESGKKVNWGDE